MKYQFSWKEIKDCSDCPCFNDKFDVCRLTAQSIKPLRYVLPSWCPLVEVEEEDAKEE